MMFVRSTLSHTQTHAQPRALPVKRCCVPQNIEHHRHIRTIV